MTNYIKNIIKYLPGIAIAGAIAVVSVFIEWLLPIHVIGASVIALFVGMIINCIKKPNQLVKKGLNFTSKKLLKLAIILLGASLSVSVILQVGQLSLVVMLFTLFTCFGIGFVVGRLLKLNWKMSNLISAGTGICGGSAIGAIAPVIEAENKDIAIAMSATFLFDMVMVILFPIVGNALGLSDMGFGLWAGTAINDTSSVVAAGLAFSESACEFATMVKLTRTLSIIPTVIVFALINFKLKKRSMMACPVVSPSVTNNDARLDNTIKKEAEVESGSIDVHKTICIDSQVIKNDDSCDKSKLDTQQTSDSAVVQDSVKMPKLKIAKIIPWFILGFLSMAILNSVGLIPESVSSALKEISKFLMVMALASIGLCTSVSEVKSSGIKPMLHGFIISFLVVVVALGVQYMLHIV